MVLVNRSIGKTSGSSETYDQANTTTRGAITRLSIPVTWVTVYTGDMGNTFAAKGRADLVMRPVS